LDYLNLRGWYAALQPFYPSQVKLLGLSTDGT
jgi:hypothetical protein